MNKRTTIVAITAAVALLAPAGAGAHVQENVPTSITIKASDTRVSKGQKVTFTGKLKSSWKQCRSKQNVRLYRGSKVVARKVTNKKGNYKFTRQIKKKGKYRVKYSGRSWGVHPHSHSCLPSQSKVVKIRLGG